MVGFRLPNVGDSFRCLYPVHGSRNILRIQSGRVQRTGKSFVTIKREDGKYRSLSALKMVSPRIG